MNLSLHARLLLATTIMLTAFLGITGLVLDRAFQESVESALQDRLQGHIYALLAAAELGADKQLHISDRLPDPRFATADSGLYAIIKSDNHQEIWRSDSAIGVEPDFHHKPNIGQRRFDYVTLGTTTTLLTLSYAIEWETDTTSQRFYFYVAEDRHTSIKQIKRFRKNLWLWFGVAGVLLLLVQGTILHWGLAPLRQVSVDLKLMESGQNRRLSGAYPGELRGLTDNINDLMAGAHAHLARYRDALGNLAHTLKTPLAVMRGVTDDDNTYKKSRQVVQEQTERMNDIVDYQLQRAATAGRTRLSGINVLPIVEKVVSALTKVYRQKNVSCSVEIDSDVCFQGDEGDLFEILGNLMDNAFKWCSNAVTISARNITGNEDENRLQLTIQNDGVGIPPDKIKLLLERGQQGDTNSEGQGLGLAMVSETVNIYKGELSIENTANGGVRITVTL